MKRLAASTALFEAHFHQYLEDIGYTGIQNAVLGNGATPNIVVVPPAQAEFKGAMWARTIDTQDNTTQLIQVAQHWAGVKYDNSGGDTPIKIGYPPQSKNLSIVGNADTITQGAGYGGMLPSQWADYLGNSSSMNRMLDLRLKAAGGLKVKLATGHYIRDGVPKFYKHDGTLDLTSYVPSTSNLMKYVLVYLSSSDVLGVVDGTEYDIGQLVPVEQGCPTALPSGAICLGAVKLINGVTEIEETPHIKALPHLISVSTSSGGSAIAGYSQLRLTSITGDPVPEGDNSASGTLYLTEFVGQQINLYNTTSSEWEEHQLTSEISLSLTGFTATYIYDIFVYDNAGTLTLQAVSWGGSSSRATALGDQNGIRVMASDKSKLYIGKILIDSGGGTCTQSLVNLGVSNYYNRHPMSMGTFPSADSWLYNSDTIREWGGGAGGAGAVRVTMVSEPKGFCHALMSATINSPAGNQGVIGFGLNSTTTFTSGLKSTSRPSRIDNYEVGYNTPLSEGLNVITANERCSVNAGGNVTFYGDAGVPTYFQMGFSGWSLQ